MADWTREDEDEAFPSYEKCRHCGGSGRSTGHKQWCVLR